MSGPILSVVPAGPLCAVQTIEAIGILRRTGIPTLLEAKRTIEAMIRDGSANCATDGFEALLGLPDVDAVALALEGDLLRAGVALLADGRPVSAHLSGSREAGP